MSDGQGYDAETAHRFTYHPPTPEQPEVYEAVRDLAHLFVILVESSTYPSRERSLAVTKAEEAVMWANAGIARRGLSAAGIAGASDLLEHATQQLLAAAPERALAGFLSDTLPPPADDPWPPDGHLTPVLEPLPASQSVDVLRSGLGLLVANRFHRGLEPENCAGCIAQSILNGEPIPTEEAAP